jgi:murein DD-endopeptidase MepM/ murein hydrolase activator NlpD
VLQHLALARVLLPLLLLLPVICGAAVPSEPDARGIHTGWGWPLAPRPAVIRTFDPPERPWLSGHRGVDLRATLGQEVRTPADGIVSFVGRVVDRDVVTIDHGHGLRSSFEPVESDLTRGAVVTAGQAVGRLAATPMHCPGGCLHWGVRDDGDGPGGRETTYIDPLRLVADTRPSVLLPWRDP